jgi:hypothetical protein
MGVFHLRDTPLERLKPLLIRKMRANAIGAKTTSESVITLVLPPSKLTHLISVVVTVATVTVVHLLTVSVSVLVTTVYQVLVEVV